MGYSKYTDEQISQFIDISQEMGISPAMRYLNYPGSYHTASKWFKERNLDLPDIDSLKQMARNIGVFYSDKEKVISAQAVIDRAVEKLMEDDTLLADDINKLSNAIHKAIQTINLIEGKSTNINENRSKDGTDLAIHDLLNEAKIKNEMKKNNIVNDISDNSQEIHSNSYEDTTQS